MEDHLGMPKKKLSKIGKELFEKKRRKENCLQTN